jgi:hypothetical protein
VYLTSFIHREDLFDITERWLCGRLKPDDGLRITQILICDGFVVGETLETMTNLLHDMIDDGPFQRKYIHFKGELRDAICRSAQNTIPRVDELIHHYKSNPDFFYKEAPVNGVICLDKKRHFWGFYRIKRPRRIAEKANRYIANWIFRMVQDRAHKMAEERAGKLGVPIERLLTPKEEMACEFANAEGIIAGGFKEETMELDRSALTIHDVGGIKIVADDERLSHLERTLLDHPMITIVDKEKYLGNYQANSLILEVSWDKEYICRRYIDSRAWKKYLNRGIPEEELQKGLEPLLDGAKPTLNVELILSTLPDMVESELGNSIHEERIIAQRNNKVYKGYIPTNVEFLIEYLFAVGLSPRIAIDSLPIKLWGRYLPDTISSHIRELYQMPEYGVFY